MGVAAAVWGGGTHTRAPTTPTGLPYPSAAPSGPEGLGWNRRCARGGPLRVSLDSHGASLPPPRPGQDRRDSGVTAAVWGGEPLRAPPNPHRASLSLRGPGGPERLGCNRRCVGEELMLAP